MYVFDVQNVNQAWHDAWHDIYGDKLMLHARPSRYGDVLEFNEPVTTVYRAPWECVLLDAGRDANPFLHMADALWILAGRNDVKFLVGYAERMKEFSDNGVTYHGAYGYRWRKHFNLQEAGFYDQLAVCVAMLKDNNEERRAVLAMWDPCYDLGAKSKDLPCNTHVYLKVRQGKLIATVCCRSNDLVLGAYGANAVQLAFLQQYVAAAVGVPAGALTQVSDSMHVYTKPLNGKAWADYLPPAAPAPYPGTMPLVKEPSTFLREVEEWLDDKGPTTMLNPWLANFGAARNAWRAWKGRHHKLALDYARTMPAPDWKAACVAWLERHIAAREAKKDSMFGPVNEKLRTDPEAAP
jgi:hypothetical protein